MAWRLDLSACNGLNNVVVAFADDRDKRRESVAFADDRGERRESVAVVPDERGESVAIPDELLVDEGGESIASLVSGPVPLPPSLRRHEERESMWSMASLLVVEVSFALPAGCMVTILVYFLK